MRTAEKCVYREKNIKGMIFIKYIQLNSKSNEEQKQEFERLVLLNGADLDIHQNRNTPEEILSK